jgi:glycosyltransferase involved in cell wall biosynthesis
MPRVLAVNSRAAIRNIAATGMPVEHIYYLPNVVDTDHFRPATRPPAETVRLLAIGRLVNQKRFDRFLSILARLRRESTKPVKGVIVGAGPYRERLEGQAVELGLLPDALEFKGSVQDLKPIYQDADILVSTSDYEGTPNVVLEAMASGLPVVATRVGDVPDIVRHGETGYLSDPEDSQAMTDTLLALINQTELRAEIGDRARKHIEANHSVNRLPGLLEDLYSEALS